MLAKKWAIVQAANKLQKFKIFEWKIINLIFHDNLNRLIDPWDFKSIDMVIYKWKKMVKLNSKSSIKFKLLFKIFTIWKIHQILNKRINFKLQSDKKAFTWWRTKVCILIFILIIFMWEFTDTTKKLRFAHKTACIIQQF